MAEAESDKLRTLVTDVDPPYLYDADGNPIRFKDEPRRASIADPGQPMPATEAEGTPPRSLIPRFGQNLSITPRSTFSGSVLTSFQQLRALADFDLCRVAIEDLKGRITGMEYDIQPKKEFKDATGLQADMDAARRWTERPDPLADLEWPDWLAKVLEEILTTDALALYPHFTRGGDFIGLEQLDGPSILPLVDRRGRPPLPPAFAFQQIVEGIPETAFRMGELWYLPLNRRIDSPYGRPPNEQVIITVNIATRHSLYDLGYYTDGNLPDALWSFPETWTEQQIKDYQMYFDSLLSGRITGRSGGLRFIPAGNYITTKTQTWQYDFLEWLGRVIAWSYGVSPLPIARLTGRNPSEVLSSSMAESGIRGRMKIIARVMNRVITKILGRPRVEFVWMEDEAEDAATVTSRQRELVSVGGKLLNEIRRENGDAPYPEAWANKPLLLTGSGAMLMEDAIRLGAQGPAAPQPAGLGPSNGEPGEPAAVAPAQMVNASTGSPYKSDAGLSDLALWRRAAISRARRGKPHRPFESEDIPELLRSAIQAKLEKAATPEAVQEAFTGAEATLKKKAQSLSSPRRSFHDPE